MQVPLSAFATTATTNTPLAVNHQGQFAASTISFNLPDRRVAVAGDGRDRQGDARMGVPRAIHGTLRRARRGRSSSRCRASRSLILAALLDDLHRARHPLRELLHPLTILSTLPSAGVGALLALLLFKTEFSLIALIGVILLIGIVKKNAIMMIDFALDAERSEACRRGKPSSARARCAFGRS